MFLVTGLWSLVFFDGAKVLFFTLLLTCVAVVVLVNLAMFRGFSSFIHPRFLGCNIKILL